MGEISGKRYFQVKHIGRKFYHLFGGLILLSLYYVLGRERALLIYAVLFLAAVSLDAARLMIPAFNRFMFSRFRSFIRESEEHSLTGTPAYVLGIGLSLYLYAFETAAAAVCFLAFGDVAATTIGERFGKTKIRGKSLEGTAAFVVAAMAAGFFLSRVGVHIDAAIIIVGALVAAGVELLPLPLNDNLTIPLISGGAMQLLSGWIS